LHKQQEKHQQQSGKSSENIRKTADIESATTESSSAVYEIATARSFNSKSKRSSNNTKYGNKMTGAPENEHSLQHYMEASALAA
jgi:hypothetical protein